MFHYVAPHVEIISFLARQAFATSEETTDDTINLGQTDLSMEETVGPWD